MSTYSLNVTYKMRNDDDEEKSTRIFLVVSRLGRLRARLSAADADTLGSRRSFIGRRPPVARRKQTE